MDNDALLRRISSATGSKNPQRQVNVAETPIQPAVPTPEAAPTGAPQASHGPPINRVVVPGPQVPPTAAASGLPAAPTGMMPRPAPVAQPSPLPSIHDHVPSTPAPVAPAQPLAETPISVDEAPMTFVLPASAQAQAVQPTDRLPRNDHRGEGYVVTCNGTMAIVQGDTGCVDSVTGLTWAVGRMLSIKVGDNRIVGMICDIEMPYGNFEKNKQAPIRFHVELQGEVQDTPSGRKFTKGISSYPGVGSVVHQIRSQDLASIYAATGTVNAFVGSLTQDSTILDLSRFSSGVF